MVSCDTPEKAGYAGAAPRAQAKLAACRHRLETGFYPRLPRATADYLRSKLSDTAAERHITAGVAATSAFLQLQSERLVRPDGKQRKVAVIPAGEVIDSYGRLLA